MNYSLKSSSSHADFITRTRGIDDYPEHTVEITFTFDNDGKAFKDELKRALPPGTWHYAGDGRWFILPKFQEQAEGIARKHFRRVYRTSGTKSVELKSGQVHEQRGLFG
jgi:hypothetical protein